MLKFSSESPSDSASVWPSGSPLGSFPHFPLGSLSDSASVYLWIVLLVFRVDFLWVLLPVLLLVHFLCIFLLELILVLHLVFIMVLILIPFQVFHLVLLLVLLQAPDLVAEVWLGSPNT